MGNKKNENPPNPLPPLCKRPQLYHRVLRRTFRLPAAMRFKIPQIGLELVQIGNILIIAGSNEALKPFRSTQATFLVDSLDEFKAYLEEKGADILRGPNKVPTGRNMTVKHPDDSIIEYVEHSNPA